MPRPAALAALLSLLLLSPARAADAPPAARDSDFGPAFVVPEQYAGQLGKYRSPLLFDDGTPVRTAAEWPRRRQEILAHWTKEMGAWPPLLSEPKLEVVSTEKREDFTQHKVRVQVAAKQSVDGYLLVPPIPPGERRPAVLVVFYDPETSTGQAIDPKTKLPKKNLRDFAYQLTKRGFVTLSIGSPGGDARKPDTAGHVLQPLSYLAYVAANCHTALARRPEVDPAKIGVTGHSYGGKWAMFASCLYDKFAAAAWSDGGVVWDEPRSNVNYWEPWYLGLDPAVPNRKPGLVTEQNPRTGAYKRLFESGHDLHELHALMAPRPFLVSGGSEDGPGRWVPLNHAVAVNKLLGHAGRVGMTNRPKHDPTEESNEAMYRFFEQALMGK
ncbi:MAG TPA: hypothetical protein VF796_01775 [Humisphaera sp.]